MHDETEDMVRARIQVILNEMLLRFSNKNGIILGFDAIEQISEELLDEKVKTLVKGALADLNPKELVILLDEVAVLKKAEDEGKKAKKPIKRTSKKKSGLH